MSKPCWMHQNTYYTMECSWIIFSATLPKMNVQTPRRSLSMKIQTPRKLSSRFGAGVKIRDRVKKRTIYQSLVW